MKKLLLITLLTLGATQVSAGYNVRPGAGVDSHGCPTDGGYTWCASIGKCVRPWETPCPTLPSPAGKMNCPKGYYGNAETGACYKS